MRVLVLHDEVHADSPPDALDILAQAEAVAGALTRLGHEPETLGCGPDLPLLADDLERLRPDLVFNLVESLGGQGRLIHVVPGWLDVLGVAYAGCPAEALYTTSHKVLAKRLLAGAGLPTPAWFSGPDGALEPVADGPEPERCLVKSVWEDASLGLDDASLVPGSRASVRTAMDLRGSLPGAPWFAETYVEGREFNLSLLEGPDGPQVLPPAELRFVDYPPGKPRIVHYAAKWDEDSFEYSHTVRRFDLPDDDAPLATRLETLALACWRLFDLRGWARVDFRVDACGEPWILEANANPCLSPDAGFQAAVARAGLDFDEAIARILAATHVPNRVGARP
ncbi:D-alanine--D-alanine ligase [bacterium]|nr:D-alanine--D-alanine ligase [bacterium]